MVRLWINMHTLLTDCNKNYETPRVRNRKGMEKSIWDKYGKGIRQTLFSTGTPEILP